MDRATLDATHLGSESSRNDANPYYSLVMDYFNEYDPASDFNLTCYNPVFDHNGQKFLGIHHFPIAFSD